MGDGLLLPQEWLRGRERTLHAHIRPLKWFDWLTMSGLKVVRLPLTQSLSKGVSG